MEANSSNFVMQNKRNTDNCVFVFLWVLSHLTNPVIVWTFMGTKSVMKSIGGRSTACVIHNTRHHITSTDESTNVNHRAPNDGFSFLFVAKEKWLSVSSKMKLLQSDNLCTSQRASNSLQYTRQRWRLITRRVAQRWIHAMSSRYGCGTDILISRRKFEAVLGGGRAHGLVFGRCINLIVVIWCEQRARVFHFWSRDQWNPAWRWSWIASSSPAQCSFTP